MENTTIAQIARNSLCQFCSDSNQKREEPMYSRTVTVVPPCWSCSSLYSHRPPTACNQKVIRKSRKKVRASEFSYSLSTNPPLRTGQGASGLSRDCRGSLSWGFSSSSLRDSEDPFWYRKAVSST